MAEESSSAEASYYKLVNAGGNHYDIGRKMTDAIGEKLHERLSKPVEPGRLSSILASVEPVFELHPVLKDELQGIAEGISIEMEAMLSEISDFSAGPTTSMTVVAKNGSSLVLGRTFSADPSIDVRNLLRLDPNDSYASLGRMAGYFAGTWESIGVYGQFVCADILAARGAPANGPAAYIVPRIVTESSKSTETALEKLSSISPMQDSSYVLASGDRAYTLTFTEGRMNSEEITSFPYVMVNGRTVPGGAGSISTPDEVKALLSDHSKGGCVHTKEKETLYAMIVDMGAEEIEYSDGAPCRTEYHGVDWPGGYG